MSAATALATRKPPSAARLGSTVTANDRLGFTLFMAIVVHASIVFGVSFSLEPRRPAGLTVEVTLAQYEDAEVPEDADFVAQANQQGSGSTLEKSQLTTTERAEFRDVETRKVAPNQPHEAPKQPLPPKQEVVVAETVADTAADSKEMEEPQEEGKFRKHTLLQNAREIASLEAKLDTQRRKYAKRPRVTRLDSVSAKASSSAFYMHNWVRKVERVGNLNYPEEARRRGLSGKVRVAVLIRDDGQVERIEILESSNIKVLDDAVVRIVRLAEPFGAFTDAMREEADQFEIIRTFDFGKRMSSF